MPKKRDDTASQHNSPTPRRPRARRPGQHPLPQERDELKDKFLEELAQGGVVLYAAQVAGIHRATVYEWLKTDANFKLRYDQAIEDSNDVLLREAWNRATYGTTKPAIGGGHIIYEEAPLIVKGKVVTDKNGKVVMVPVRPLMVREYSDRLMEVLLKARRPEFKDRQQLEVSGPDGGPIQQQITGTISMEDLRKLDEQTPAKLDEWKRQRGFAGRGKERLA